MTTEAETNVQKSGAKPRYDQRFVRPSPRQRLEAALKCVRNPVVRLKIRRIFEKEIPNASIFWDEDDRQVEFIANDWEIIIRERDDTCRAQNAQADL